MKVLLYNKRGFWKSYFTGIVIGLMVLSMAIYFLYQETVENEEAWWARCKNSVNIRANAVEFEGYKPVSLKEAYPLECKTEVKTIGFEDVALAEKLFADTLAECWYTFGEGEKKIFVTKEFRA